MDKLFRFLYYFVGVNRVGDKNKILLIKFVKVLRINFIYKFR